MNRYSQVCNEIFKGVARSVSLQLYNQLVD